MTGGGRATPGTARVARLRVTVSYDDGTTRTLAMDVVRECDLGIREVTERGPAGRREARLDLTATGLNLTTTPQE